MTRLEVLSIDACGLKALPVQIGECSSLKRLSVDGNALTALPAEIGKLAKLESFSAASNQLTVLPDEIGNLSVSELILSRNQLASLPASLARNQSLKIVKADENCLEDGSIPLAVFGDSSICSLSLEGNPFSEKNIRDTPEYEKVRDFARSRDVVSLCCGMCSHSLHALFPQYMKRVTQTHLKKM